MKVVEGLREPEVLKKIGKLKSTGMGSAEIARIIKRDHGIQAGPRAIDRTYETYLMRQGEVIAGDQELKSEIKGIILDTKDQLVEINNEMRNILQHAKSQGLKIAAAKEILNQLHFQELLITRLTDGFKMQSMSRVEVTQIFINNLERLEKDGYIKIIQKPGELPRLEDINKEEQNGNENRQESEVRGQQNSDIDRGKRDIEQRGISEHIPPEDPKQD